MGHEKVTVLVLSREQYHGEIPGTAPAPEMDSGRFAVVVERILEAEGGFSDHPRDNGKATKYGITTATLAAWRGMPVTKQQVKDLTKDEARDIYEKKYWLPCECDVLPKPFDMLVFNLAVNAGNFRSQDLFQDALNMLGFNVKNDGDIGPETYSALKRADPHALVMAYKTRAERFYRELNDFDVFGNGWLNRLNKFTKYALSELPAMQRSPLNMSVLEGWPHDENSKPEFHVEEKPQITAADKALGGETFAGLKTYIGIVAYAAIEVAEALGYLPTATADVLTPVAAGLAGIGLVSKVERYLSYLRMFTGKGK